MEALLDRKYSKQDKQRMYVLRNTEAPLCNHRYCGETVRITYSKSISVALVIQHAKRMSYYIVTCGLSGFPISFQHNFRI